jgi:hypothetical protein
MHYNLAWVMFVGSMAEHAVLVSSVVHLLNIQSGVFHLLVVHPGDVSACTRLSQVSASLITPAQQTAGYEIATTHGGRGFSPPKKTGFPPRKERIGE